MSALACIHFWTILGCVLDVGRDILPAAIGSYTIWCYALLPCSVLISIRAIFVRGVAGDATAWQRLRQLLQPVMWRNSKAQVAADLQLPSCSVQVASPQLHETILLLCPSAQLL